MSYEFSKFTTCNSFLLKFQRYLVPYLLASANSQLLKALPFPFALLVVVRLSQPTAAS